MPTSTANYGWQKPDIGASNDAWGGLLNADLDGIDSTVFSVSGTATAALSTANTASTTANAALPTAGGTMTGALNANAPGGAGVYGLTVQPTSGSANMLLQSSGNNINLVLAKGASGANNVVAGMTGVASASANMRWNIQVGNATAEGTNNVGSDFAILNFNNSGVALATPFLIDRSSGYTVLSGAGATPVPSPAVANGSASAALRLNKAGTGNISAIQGHNNGVLRWNMALGYSEAESGGGVGSNFVIQNCGDAGNIVATPLSINRSTQVTTFSVAIVNGPSDRRLKENIKPIDDALAKVMGLKGVSFNFIATPDKSEIGLIAQDVQPIVPEVIQRFDLPEHQLTKDVPYMGLDYPKLTALLVEAVKTLAARVEALEAAR